MARVPRGELLPDWGVFHVVTRGVAETWIYGDDFDRRYFLGLLACVVDEFQLECEVFCLMNTHYHAVRYVLANPVRAGLCDDPAAWRWSGSRYGHDVW